MSTVFENILAGFPSGPYEKEDRGAIWPNHRLRFLLNRAHCYGRTLQHGILNKETKLLTQIQVTQNAFASMIDRSKWPFKFDRLEWIGI